MASTRPVSASRATHTHHRSALLPTNDQSSSHSTAIRRRLFPPGRRGPRGLLVHGVHVPLEPGLGYVQDAGDGGPGDPLGQHLLYQALLPVRDGGLLRVGDGLPAAGQALVVRFAGPGPAVLRHPIRLARRAAQPGGVPRGWAALLSEILTIGALPASGSSRTNTR